MRMEDLSSNSEMGDSSLPSFHSFQWLPLDSLDGHWHEGRQTYACIYIFGQVKNRGLEKSQGLIQHGPAFSRHTLWEGRLNRLHSCTCKIQSSRNLLNSYCDRPRSPRRHQSKALACMHCTIRIDRSRGLLKTERKGAGEMGWWLRALTALEEDLASLSSTSQQIIIICKSSFQE